MNQRQRRGRTSWRAVLLPLLLAFAARSAGGQATQSEAAARSAIDGVLRDFVAAWNRHDIAAWAPLFTPDAHFVVITAKHLKGFAEIAEYHKALHEALYKEVEIKGAWEDVKFVRPEVAVGHVRFEPGNAANKRWARATVVLVRDQGVWRVTAFQNTLLYGPRPAEQFPPDSGAAGR